MSWLDLIPAPIKVSIGYEKRDHRFDSSRFGEGDTRILDNGDMIKNEKGRLVYYKKTPTGRYTGRPLPVKERE